MFLCTKKKKKKISRKIYLKYFHYGIMDAINILIENLYSQCYYLPFVFPHKFSFNLFCREKMKNLYYGAGPLALFFLFPSNLILEMVFGSKFHLNKITIKKYIFFITKFSSTLFSIFIFFFLHFSHTHTDTHSDKQFSSL